MRAFLIDSKARRVTPVDYSGDFSEIYKLIGADLFDCVRINARRDVVFVDDMGLYSGRTDCFLIDGYPSPLVGSGLVVGTGPDGESCDASITLEELQEACLFGEIS